MIEFADKISTHYDTINNLGIANAIVIFRKKPKTGEFTK
jgi:hypothetical protein